MRLVTTLSIVLALAMPSLARAQDINANSAIHALAGPHRHHHHHRRHGVRIPRHRHHVRRFGILLPPGTTRPGPSRNFIPAR